MEQISKEIEKLLKKAGVTGEVALSIPPKPEMGDFAFACFGAAKILKKNPAEMAKELESKINKQKLKIVERVQVFGPYLNFFLNGSETAKIILEEIRKQKGAYGSHQIGKGKKYVIEFACPNPLKAFHLGHLKNLITGESVVRIFENAGYNVKRVNYQGDVGMQVAKAIWGILDWKDQFQAIRSLGVKEKVEFLGKAYAHGAAHFESSESAKAEVVQFNDIIYEEKDLAVMKIYREARQWSLDYFDQIYQRLNSHFDRLYFESDLFKRALELADISLKEGILLKSDGAIIFPGSKYKLHDRVFVNSKGFPTYEAKDLALAEKHFHDFKPDKVIHVVGKEQTEYFKVVFKALEFVLPQTKGKEYHLAGGFLQLRGEQKMSSRKGNIVTGDQLLEEVTERVEKVMSDNFREGKSKDAKILEKVANAALKYGMLKNNVSQDVSFDMEESLSVTGDSGPYLLYVVARIKSILNKAKGIKITDTVPAEIVSKEKELLIKLVEFPNVTEAAVQNYDPSKVAHYLFELAQSFTSFYEACPVLKAEADVKEFRLSLISAVLIVAERGLNLLGIESVEEM